MFAGGHSCAWHLKEWGLAGEGRAMALMLRTPTPLPVALHPCVAPPLELSRGRLSLYLDKKGPLQGLLALAVSSSRAAWPQDQGQRRPSSIAAVLCSYIGEAIPFLNYSPADQVSGAARQQALQQREGPLGARFGA
jgi:hypothetical protein